MDTFMNELATIVNIISENFWLILLIFMMYADKKTRIGAIALLATYLLFGNNLLLYALVLIITYGTEYGDAKRYYRNKYKKKLDRYKRVHGIETTDEVAVDDATCSCDNGNNPEKDLHETIHM